MKPNHLKQLEALGQSIWLDYIKRDMLMNGELQKFITEDGLRGMTSNPDIFEKAITGSHDYDSDIREMVKSGKSTEEIYNALTVKDVQTAADIFQSVYQKTNGKDGFVSLEVNPHLAHDSQGTIASARYLWKALNRPNVFIKVPATKEGLIAIKQLTCEGINVNITLLFGLDRYREVAEAYISGLEERLKNNESIEHINSVASFFLSRIDTLVDPIFEKIIAKDNEKSSVAKELYGQTAIASAKIAYQIFLEIFHSERFNKLSERGAAFQRLLWASTSTKNPKFCDIKYVDSIIAPDTVNTVPMETLEHYRDHGDPKLRIESDLKKVLWQFEQLPNVNINIDDITQQLEDEGVLKFNKAYDKLIAALKQSAEKGK